MGMMEDGAKDLLDVTSSGKPESDLRELEGEVNREADGRTDFKWKGRLQDKEKVDKTLGGDELVMIPSGMCTRVYSGEFLLFLRSNGMIGEGVMNEMMGDDYMNDEYKNLLFGNSNNVKMLMGILRDDRCMDEITDMGLREMMYNDPSLMYIGNYVDIIRLYNIPNKGNILLVEPYVNDEDDNINIIISTNIRIINNTNITFLLTQDFKLNYFNKLAYKLLQKDQPNDTYNKYLYINPLTSISIPISWYNNGYMPVITPIFDGVGGNYGGDDEEDNSLDFQELYKLLNKQNIINNEENQQQDLNKIEFNLNFKNCLSFKCNIIQQEINKIDNQHDIISYKYLIYINPIINIINNLPFNLTINISKNKTNIINHKILKPNETWGLPFGEQKFYMKIKINGCQLECTQINKQYYTKNYHYKGNYPHYLKQSQSNTYSHEIQSNEKYTKSPHEVQSNSSYTLPFIRPADRSPPEVGPAVSSPNYLSLKSRTTPGDRGEESETIHGSRGEVNREATTASGMKSRIGPLVEPVADLREAEGQLNRRADGRTTSGGLDLKWYGRNIPSSSMLEYVSPMMYIYIPNVGVTSMVKLLRYMDGPLDEIIGLFYEMILQSVNDYYKNYEILYEYMKRMYITIDITRNTIKISWPYIFENITTNFILLNNYLIPPGYRFYGNLHDAYNTKLRAFINLGNKIYLHTNQSSKLDLTQTTQLRPPINLNVPFTQIKKYIIQDNIDNNHHKQFHEPNTNTNDTSSTESYTKSPLEVQSNSLRPADSSSNYLSLKSIATPGDRGEVSDGSSIMGMMEDGAKVEIRIGPQVEPVADLREAKGEVNRRAVRRTTKVGGNVAKDVLDVTSGGEDGVKMGYGDNKPHISNHPHNAINNMTPGGKEVDGTLGDVSLVDDGVLLMGYDKLRRLKRRVMRIIDDNDEKNKLLSMMNMGSISEDDRLRQDDRGVSICIGCSVRYIDNGIRVISIGNLYTFVNNLPFTICIVGVPGDINNIIEFNCNNNLIKDLILKPGEMNNFNTPYSHAYIIKLENTMYSGSFPLITSHIPNVIQLELNSLSIVYTTMVTRGILIQIDIITGNFNNNKLPYIYNGYYYILSIPNKPQYQILNLTSYNISFTIPDNIKTIEAQMVDNYDTYDNFETNLINKINILSPFCITHYVPNNIIYKNLNQHQVALKILNVNNCDWFIQKFSFINNNINTIKLNHNNTIYTNVIIRHSGTIIIILSDNLNVIQDINTQHLKFNWNSILFNLKLPKISITIANKRKIFLALHLTNIQSYLKIIPKFNTNSRNIETNYNNIPEDYTTTDSTRRPPKVTTLSSTSRSTVGLADSSPNYLSLNGGATPGDRGSEETWIGPQVEVEPVADLREAKGEVIKRADGRTKGGGDWKTCGGVWNGECDGWVIETSTIIKMVHVDHFVQGYIPVILKSLAKRHSRQESFLQVRIVCILSPKSLPIYDSIYIKTSPLSINVEMRVLEQLFDYIEMIKLQSDGNDKQDYDYSLQSRGIALPEPRWIDTKSRLPVYIMKFNIEPINLVLAIRTSEVKLSRQTLQLLDSLPLDTPSVCVHFASEKRNHTILCWNELVQSLKHSYLRQLIRQSLPSAWLSSSFALLHGVIKGTCLLFSQPFVSCNKFKNSFEGFILGIGNGIILFILYIFGGLAQSLGHVLNIFHKLMGRGRPRPQSILDALWLGINGLLLDLFFRPWKRLISDFRKSHGKGDSKTKIGWKLISNLTKCILCPIIGIVNMLITIVEGLSNVLLGDFEQFTHVYESDQLGNLLQTVDDKDKQPTTFIKRMKTATLRKFT